MLAGRWSDLDARFTSLRFYCPGVIVRTHAAILLAIFGCATGGESGKPVTEVVPAPERALGWLSWLGKAAPEVRPTPMPTLPTSEPPPPAPPEGSCNGYEEQLQLCHGLPPCVLYRDCVPVDCTWGAWMDWYDDSDGNLCTGLLTRSRLVVKDSNECGQQCSGQSVETRRHHSSRVSNACKRKFGKDCQLGEWRDWSECKFPHDQKYRIREVDFPAGTGEACDGFTQETVPCLEEYLPRKCELSDWQHWTECSSTCGAGQHSRLRHVVKQPRHSTTCEGALLETAPCYLARCPSKDCIFGDWSAWEDCDLAHPKQRQRHREIFVDATGDGRRCENVTVETEGCPPQPEPPSECEISDWGEWEKCDKACDGGQTFRSRTLVTPSDRGVQCSVHVMRETRPCSTAPCWSLDGVEDCFLGVWTLWSDCSTTCGEGLQSRKRKVKRLAEPGGRHCRGSLEETKPCWGTTVVCAKTDCVWSKWTEWSACSASCAGGRKKRMRHVTVAPEHGGKLCEENDGAEVAPCSTEPCVITCTDGKWESWQDWQPCSGTCSSSFRVRRREVAQDANHCGRPLYGEREEFVTCHSLPPCMKKQDCRLSSWDDWSGCSCSCFGVRERNRAIEAHARAGGQPCSAPIREVEPCNPGSEEPKPVECIGMRKQDCLLQDWSAWSLCSRTCGGGQTHRSRRVLHPPRNGGEECDTRLSVVRPCGTKPCRQVKCLSCRWGAWSEWGACAGVCEAGQRTRHRSIEQLPNFCGLPCNMEAAIEASNCTASCQGIRVCAWTDWSTASACTGCGTSNVMRTRSLGLRQLIDNHTIQSHDPHGLFSSQKVLRCSGTQVKKSLCPDLPRSCTSCEPRDCEFGSWGEWSRPTCEGLCHRGRSVRTPNNECGQPCAGTLIDTKKCRPVCIKKSDCVFSAWHAWSDCNSPLAQRYRARSILHEPKNGGKGCQAVLLETVGCTFAPPKPCELSDWSSWSSCPRTCGGSMQTRKRHILREATGGGTACLCALEELQGCGVFPCAGDVDCKFSAWSDWMGCRIGQLQQSRERTVSRESKLHGDKCRGGLREIKACSTHPVDCIISAWTDWDACDRKCGEGQGQQHRQRQIHQYPDTKLGGKPCPNELVETKGCFVPCPRSRDCIFTQWSQWNSCTTPCGAGQHSRARKIDRPPKSGGKPCIGVLRQVADCNNFACKDEDCKWGEWADWDICSRSCGGGFRGRHRGPMTVQRGQGKQCQPANWEEVATCNMKPCPTPCVDGKWGAWTRWSPCSMSCEGGSKSRIRRIFSEPKGCGKPPTGKDRETRLCNRGVPCWDVDCEFAQWTDWGDCTSTCSGVQTRNREIATHARGNGKRCQGVTEQAKPCGVDPHVFRVPGYKSECGEGPSVDCVLSIWSSWSGCREGDCMHYLNRRNRSIKQHALNGGEPCSGPLEEAESCQPFKCLRPKDCEQGDWEDWGACSSSCGGYRKRFRHVLHYPERGGQLCLAQSSEQVDHCGQRCHTYCIWDTWKAWSSCSASCGHGVRKRRRELGLSADPSASAPAKAAIAKYEALQREVMGLGPPSTKELLTAFSLGCLTYVAAFYIARRWPTRRRERRSAASLALGPSANDVAAVATVGTADTRPLVRSAGNEGL